MRSFDDESELSDKCQTPSKELQSVGVGKVVLCSLPQNALIWVVSVNSSTLTQTGIPVEFHSSISKTGGEILHLQFVNHLHLQNRNPEESKSG